MPNNVKVSMGSEEPKDEEIKEVDEPNVNEPVEDEVDLDDSEPDYESSGATLDDYPDDEEIWDGGPTVGQAKEWKAAYGRIVVGALDNGDRYMIRPLNRTEYKNHIIAQERARSEGNLQAAETLATEEAIALIGLLYPPMDERQIRTWGLAGLPTLISQQILEISGFVAAQTIELF